MKKSSGIVVESSKNKPELWLKSFPFPQKEQNKYDRGHVVVSGGGIECTGAACLSAISALRVGAGLVTVASPTGALPVYATKLTSVMVKPFRDIEEFKELIIDKRKNVVLLGPGNGVNEVTAEKVEIALSLKKACVIDADAISVFENKPNELFKRIKSPVVLTPHEGEFARIFSYKGSKIQRAGQAAKKSKAVIVLKGSDTVIASPEGNIVINSNAPATLATAGTGDVLAGIISGLMAQGMEAFQAACAGVWLHSKAAEIAGLGMIAEDLPHVLPMVIEELFNPSFGKKF